MPINFSDPYTLTAYGPTYGPMEGGNTIRIEGEGFVGDFTNCIPDIDDVSRDCACATLVLKAPEYSPQ
jgi:hypothetical protein